LTNKAQACYNKFIMTDNIKKGPNLASVMSAAPGAHIALPGTEGQPRGATITVDGPSIVGAAAEFASGNTDKKIAVAAGVGHTIVGGVDGHGNLVNTLGLDGSPFAVTVRTPTSK
jgi:hypothetical protein